MLLSLATLIVLHLALATPLSQANQMASLNLTKPYWRRTGCYLVGHTRNISIPGCLKFSLSTNACRGYCMSYSIPVNHDIGPVQQSEVVEELDGSMRKIANHQQSLTTATTTTTTATHHQRQNQKLQQQQQQQQQQGPIAPVQLTAEQQEQQQKQLQQKIQELQSTLVAADLADGGERILEFGSTAGNGTIRWTKNKSLSPAATSSMADKTMASAQDSASTAGTSSLRSISNNVANTKLEVAGKTREVLSVSRCCSMVETEDRVYNVRCGNNEVRRLVFKSAKSCECFFCKQD